MSEARVQLAAIAVHPVKSTAVRPVREAAVEPWGLAGDRRWMVVGSDGECLTAREHRLLLSVVADTPDTTALEAPLRLTAPGMPDLHVEEPHGAPVPVTVHGRGLYAVVAPPEAGAWVEQVVDVTGLRLVHVAQPRLLNPAHSAPGDATAFADAYPVTLATAASLRRLDEWVAETARERGEEPRGALEIARFRPNLLIEGDLEPFEEDHWRRVQVGDVEFRVAKPVDRCVMTTIDPLTRDGGHEPIRTLARHRKWEGATWFAVQLVPDVAGTITVGDEVVPRR
ncbi:MAG: MOSC N-terminal beta barrel domain-containing protein [Ornithinibacter sp.]